MGNKKLFENDKDLGIKKDLDVGRWGNGISIHFLIDFLIVTQEIEEQFEDVCIGKDDSIHV